MNDLIVGIDIGGTKIAAGLIERDGVVARRAQRPTPASDGSQAILAAAMQVAIEVRGANPISAIGIGSAGVVDPVTGVISSATATLAGWAGTEMTAPFRETFGAPVTVVNDVHAHGIAEANFGAGRGHRMVLVIAIGTGVGAAVVLDGKVLLGARGSAGHVGHIAAAAAAGLPCTCGRVGHLEAIAAGPALARRYAKLAHRPPTLSAQAVLSRATDDAMAREAVETSAGAMGEAIGGLINTVDPSIVVITGGLATSPPVWWHALHRGVANCVLPALANTPVRAGSLAQDAGIVGAAEAARGRTAP